MIAVGPNNSSSGERSEPDKPGRGDAAEGVPLVSILIPAYNAARWIAEAIESATNQTYERIEIIVADNASSDETLEIARSFSDPRIRVHESPLNLGLVGNHNLLAQLSNGRYLKYLHADDLLYPQCVASMVGLATTDASVGLVFAPRDILATGPHAAAWIAEFGRQHERFDGLQPINEGRALMWQLLDRGFENWFGEPSSVLISRPALQSVGLFNPRLKHLGDLELWVRVSLRFRVGFLDRTLSAYRHHDLAASAERAATGDDWLDPLWLAESHVVANRNGPEQDRLASLRNRRLLQALKIQLIRIAHGHLDADLVDYYRYRLRPENGSRTMHPTLN